MLYALFRKNLIKAYLIRDNESLQKAACDAEAITKLAQIITQIGNEERLYYDSADSDKLKEVKNYLVYPVLCDLLVPNIIYPNTERSYCSCRNEFID